MRRAIASATTFVKKKQKKKIAIFMGSVIGRVAYEDEEVDKATATRKLEWLALRA